MTNAVVDTHGLIWYLEDSPRLGSEASQTFDASDRGEISIYVPIICLVEILYLQEKGRIPTGSLQQFQNIIKAGESNLILVDLTQDIVLKMSEISRTTVPDMPDRIIAGTALHLGLPLISRDHKIQLSQVDTIW